MKHNPDCDIAGPYIYTVKDLPKVDLSDQMAWLLFLVLVEHSCCKLITALDEGA
jgi:hypothetical protein